MEIPDHLTCLLRNLSMQVKKQQLELDMERQTGSKLGKEYVKAVYCHPDYLNGVLLAIKMNVIIPIVAIWMDLEIVILSEVKSDRGRQISYLYVTSKKKTTNELTYKTEIEFQR